MSENNYKDLLKKIIQSNDNIRLAAICGNFGTITEKVQRAGITLLLTERDTEKLIGEAIHSWQTRRKFSQKIGEGQYAMAVYGKIIRLSIPLNEYQILLITLDNILETPKLIDDIHKILQKSTSVVLEYN
ncbi:MAG: hypothetical protein HRO68_04170 [Nitrosopumilus sp.]|nr:hypothetical protein [Nitrosopumilus sp.]